MPSKESEKMLVVMPSELRERIEEWRARQRPIPNASAAVRQLIEMALGSDD